MKVAILRKQVPAQMKVAFVALLICKAVCAVGAFAPTRWPLSTASRHVRSQGPSCVQILSNPSQEPEALGTKLDDLVKLRRLAQEKKESDKTSSSRRPPLDPARSTRINSVFRTDGTTWSGAVPRERSQRPKWGEEAMGGTLLPLDDATKQLASLLVFVLKGALDVLYRDRADFARFFVLETVARVPYFAYISVLHLYESLGRHKRASWMKVHFAEADNELHHLLIMEALGGSVEWKDRWFAQHSAMAYYWACVILYLLHPRGGYHVMALIEDHAYHTYEKYVKCNEEWLKTQPAPAIAKKYYESQDMYLFDSFHTTNPPHTPRRPSITSLFDTFVCIRDDEQQHASTMESLVSHGRLSRPSQHPPEPPPEIFVQKS